MIQDDVTIDIDVVQRTRNDALNTSGAPNVHGTVITDTLDAQFDVDFDVEWTHQRHL